MFSSALAYLHSQQPTTTPPVLAYDLSPHTVIRVYETEEKKKARIARLKLLLLGSNTQQSLSLPEPPSTSSDIFRLGSLMVYRLTQGKTWIKAYEDAAALSSTKEHWLFKRYSYNLFTLLGRMLSTQPEERPTAEEIWRETRKKKRQDEPELIRANQLDEFIGIQEKIVNLLPKQSYQRKGETVTVEQWTGWLSKRINGLREQAGHQNVIEIGDSISKLSHLLMWLQDPMTSEDLAKAHSLLKNIEEVAQVKDK